MFDLGQGNSMKRILIVYDSKGGTTREIIGWIPGTVPFPVTHP